jgi:hypothetical protein
VGNIAELLEAKLRLIGAVEGDVPPDTSVLDDLYAKLRSLGPALMLENKLAQATGEVRERLEALAKANTGSGSEAAKPLLDAGVREFPSSRDPSQVYSVTFGRGGHLECTCEGFKWRGNCKHVREDLAKTCSMGLRSGEYFGGKTRRAPTSRIAFRTAFPLWEPRLSRIAEMPDCCCSGRMIAWPNVGNPTMGPRLAGANRAQSAAARVQNSAAKGGSAKL